MSFCNQTAGSESDSASRGLSRTSDSHNAESQVRFFTNQTDDARGRKRKSTVRDEGENRVIAEITNRLVFILCKRPKVINLEIFKVPGIKYLLVIILIISFEKIL